MYSQWQWPVDSNNLSPTLSSVLSPQCLFANPACVTLVARRLSCASFISKTGQSMSSMVATPSEASLDIELMVDLVSRGMRQGEWPIWSVVVSHFFIFYFFNH